MRAVENWHALYDFTVQMLDDIDTGVSLNLLSCLVQLDICDA